VARLSELAMPVLAVYGEHDLSAVVHDSAAWWKASDPMRPPSASRGWPFGALRGADTFARLVAGFSDAGQLRFQRPQALLVDDSTTRRRSSPTARLQRLELRGRSRSTGTTP